MTQSILKVAQEHFPSNWGITEIQELLRNNKLTVNEYLVICPISQDYPLTENLYSLFQNSKINEMRIECNQVIENGIDISTSKTEEDAKEHFSLDAYDQNNISNMFYAVLTGAEEYPYHADGKECIIYTKEDIIALYFAARSHIIYHTTYNNLLRELINRTESVDVLAAIYYGMELPEDLKTTLDNTILAAEKQTTKIVSTLSPTSK